MTVQHEVASRAIALRRISTPFLNAPLWVKLTGANAIIVGIAIASHNGVVSPVFLATVGAGALINAVLVILALRPLRTLERAAAELWQGNMDARASISALADRDMSRLCVTFNLLVESLIEDGVRSRELTQLVIAQAESDQVRIAHELRESMAQQLVALALQIAALCRDTKDPVTRSQMEELREMIDGMLDELRILASDVAPSLRRDAIGHSSPATAPIAMARHGQPR